MRDLNVFSHELKEQFWQDFESGVSPK